MWVCGSQVGGHITCGRVCEEADVIPSRGCRGIFEAGGVGDLMSVCDTIGLDLRAGVQKLVCTCEDFHHLMWLNFSAIIYLDSIILLSPDGSV